MSASTRTLHAKLRPYAEAFIRWLEQNGVRVTLTSSYRSPAKQRELYEKFRRGASAFPAAKPGSSLHEQRRAFDLHLEPPVYEAAGRAWESMGGRWGGRFNDPIHFEA